MKWLFLVITIIVFSNCSGTADDKIDKEAKELFLNATSELSKLGGIASFESPRGRTLFTQNQKYPIEPAQYKQLINKIILDLKRSIELDPSVNDAYHFLGVAYIMAEQSDQAIEMLKMAISSDSKRETAFIYLCSLLCDKQEFGEARSVVGGLIETYPKKELEGLLMLASIYYLEGDYRNAIDNAKKVLMIDKQDIPALLIIANSHCLLGNERDAEEEHQKIIKINPQMRTEVERIENQLRPSSRDLGSDTPTKSKKGSERGQE